MPTFLSISQIVWELELPPLKMNTKQFSLYGTTLKTDHKLKGHSKNNEANVLQNG